MALQVGIALHGIAQARSQPHHMHSAALLCHTQQLTGREVLRGLLRKVALLELAAGRRLQGREACYMGQCRARYAGM